MEKFPQLYNYALKAADEAAQLINKIYEGEFEAVYKKDGSPVTQADILSSEIITTHLLETGIPITSEESEHEDYSVRKNWKECWCVDPLDGTKEFVKRNGEFVINIALIRDHKPVFGLIASPVMDEVVFGSIETGVFYTDLSSWNSVEKWKRIQPAEKINNPIVLTCSRSHHSGSVLHFINSIKERNQEVEFLRMGSAIKFFALAKGEADTYPRFAPTMEWDIAAGQAILEALGGCVLHSETKEPLIYNKENLKNPYFVASTKAFSSWNI